MTRETIRNVIELFIAWNGETESIDTANLDSAVDFISECTQESEEAIEQLMTNAKSGIVQKDYQIEMDDGTYIDLDPSMSLKPSLAVKAGERVKVIVIKEE